MTRALCRVGPLLKPQRLLWHISKMALIDLGDMRKPYKGAEEAFDLEHLVPSKCPFEQFTKWFDDAKESTEIIEPNAMAVATASKDGIPSVRMVLLKGYDKEGFRFFTNYNSRKGQDLADNPVGSLMFYWSTSGSGKRTLSRQIRIDGPVEKLSEEDSTAYFERRPKESQIGASLSQQSSIIEGRHVLVDNSEKLKKQYAESDVLPKPKFWGGYRVKPTAIEFWQGQTTRLHDRLRFRKSAEGETIDPKVTHQGTDGWVIERLAP